MAHGVHEDTAAVTGERLVPLCHYYTTPLCYYSTALLLHCVTTPLLHCATTPLSYYSTALLLHCFLSLLPYPTPPQLHDYTTLLYSTLLYMSCLIISSHVSYPLLYSITCIAQGDCRWPTSSLHWCTQWHSVHRTHHWSAQSLQWTGHHSDLLRA